MARARSHDNGNGKLNKLDEAMSSLIRAQAQLVEVQAATQAQIAHSNAQIAESNSRIAATNAEIAEIRRETRETVARIFAVLGEHGRILAALPDAVREKIGFKPPQPK